LFLRLHLHPGFGVVPDLDGNDLVSWQNFQPLVKDHVGIRRSKTTVEWIEARFEDLLGGESVLYKVGIPVGTCLTGTRSGTPEVQGTNKIYFNLFLPSGPTPSGGWPVAIFGHSAGSNKNAGLVRGAASMAHHGIATIPIDAVGHGFGPLGTRVIQNVGDPVTFPTRGRGIDQNGDHMIGPDEGFSASRPRSLLFCH
jgi:hypothetical protein